MSTPSHHAASGGMVPPRSYLQGDPVGFGEAIRYGLRNWLVYRGRASRSAYWWFTLFVVIVEFVFDLIVTGLAAAPASRVTTVLLALAVLADAVAVVCLGMAGLALLVRRIHDIGRPGWWVLVGLVPIAGAIILLVFALCEGTPGPNRYDLGAADAAAPAQPIRCLECGAETTGAAQVCLRCGAPIIPVPPTAGPAAGQPADPTGLPHESVGQHPKPRSWPNFLVIAGTALAALVAVIVVVAMSTSSTSPNSNTSSSSPASSSSPTSSRLQLTVDQLRPGNCLQGGDLGLGASNQWPDLVTAVPCTQSHIAEVFFAADIWPQSLAYPGDEKVDSQADDRCASAFTAYDGVASDTSAFTYDLIDPDSDTWASDDRLVVCIAYESTDQHPGGAPVNYSIKDARQ
jgi:uncharacterized membrane protein YhaH (DUF805 family)